MSKLISVIGILLALIQLVFSITNLTWHKQHERMLCMIGQQTKAFFCYEDEK